MIYSLLENLAGNILNSAISILDENNKNATGHLRNSIDFQIDKNTIFFFTDDRAYYGIYVHGGADPHFPPIKPLIQWIYDKGILENEFLRAPRRLLPQFQKQDGFGYSENISKFRKAKSIAFAIARNMEKEGISSFPFIELALEKVIQIYT